MRVLALALLCFSLAVAMAARQVDNDAEWEDFKQRYGKEYESLEHEDERKGVFVSNLEAISAHNSDAANGVHSFTLGVNQYADLTADEFKATMNGLRANTNYRRSANRFRPDRMAMADEVDWRTKGLVTAVKDQGQCGSCWAFSATGSMEGAVAKATGKLVPLSEQELVDCDKTVYGCEGGFMDDAFQYVIDNHGIDCEADYPYQARDGQNCLFKSPPAAMISSFVDIPSGSESDLQKAVSTVGPISVAMDASHPSFHLYKDGVYFEPECSSTQLDHGVLAVGYGADANGTQYWIVKNSWGLTWGMNGYVLMSRNKNNNCGIATMASYPVV